MTRYSIMPVQPPGNGGWMPGPGGGNAGNAILTIDPLKGQALRTALGRLKLSYNFIGNDIVQVQGGADRLGRLLKLPGVQTAEAEQTNVTSGGGGQIQFMP